MAEPPAVPAPESTTVIVRPYPKIVYLYLTWIASAICGILQPPFVPGDVLSHGVIERSALVAVSVGSERSVLGVSDGFSCEYTRVLDWGGNSLTDALARGLELEPGEAERIKVELGLQGDRVPDGVGPNHSPR